MTEIATGCKFRIKKWWAKKRVVGCIQSEQMLYQQELDSNTMEKPRFLESEKSSDSLLFAGLDQRGNSLLVQINRRRCRESEVWLFLQLEDGRIFTLPQHPDTMIFNDRGDIFQAAGLVLENVTAFHTTRIRFNGLLRPYIRKMYSRDFGEEELVTVKFNFMGKCKASYWPYDWDLDLMTTALASESWRGVSFLGFLTDPDSRGYEQFGAMRGEIFIGHSKESAKKDFQRLEVNLPGIKIRRWGPLTVYVMIEISYLIGVFADGTVLYVGEYSSRKGLKNAQFGSLIFPNSRCTTFQWTNFRSRDFNTENALKSPYRFEFRVKSQKYRVEVRTVRRNRVRLFRTRPSHWVTDCYPVNLTLNGSNGMGIRFHSHTEVIPDAPAGHVPIYRTLTYLKNPTEPEKFIYQFYEERSRSIPISGGKGASVAMLTMISLSTDLADNEDRIGTQIQGHRVVELPPPEIYIPDGFILSASALEKTIRTNILIQRNIIKLAALVAEKKNIEALCTELGGQFMRVRMDTEVAHAVGISFRTIREKSPLTRKEFAVSVRSSCTTEDTIEVAGSGLHEARLAVSTEPDLIEAIKACWASLFTVASVEYRIRTVQPIQTGMAVVVQKMIAATAAGLLYTQNPRTGNPHETLIVSTTGLGNLLKEIEPDNFMVTRGPTQFTVSQKVIGSKKLIMRKSKKAGWAKRVNTDKSPSLTTESVIKLAKVGVTLETLFGQPMEMDWLMERGYIYILKCRPITVISQFTDYELMHEFDGAVMSNEDLYARPNSRNDMSQALTVTSMFFLSLGDHKLRQLLDTERIPDAVSNRYLPCFNYHLFLDVFHFDLRNTGKERTISEAAVGFVIMGQDFLKMDTHSIALKRPLPDKAMKWRSAYYVMNASHSAKESTSIMKTFRFYFSKEYLLDFESSLELIKDIEDNYWRLTECIRFFFKTYLVSCYFSSALMACVAKGYTVTSPVVLSDMRLLMGATSPSIPGQIPKVIEEIMRLILKSGKKREFCTLNKESNWRQWMKVNIPEANKIFWDLIKKHGHQGMNELEVLSTTWGMNPTLVFEMLQRALYNVASEAELNSFKNTPHPLPRELVLQLRTPKGWFARQVIKAILTRTREAVLKTAVARDNLVKCVHEFRLALWHLGGLMVRENYITTSDLVFFLTPNEWRTVVVTKNFNMVRRATERRRIFGLAKNLRFPDFSFGVPRPLGERRLTGNRLQGVSIYPGVRKGRAAVVKTSEELWKIQSGDILIIQRLDLAWSPFFPVLKGVVSEIGDLFSHGLVMVARDYGLPCVVGVAEATSFFVHGEFVTMDADNGVVIKGKN